MAHAVVLWNTVGKSDASSAIGWQLGFLTVTGTSRDRLNYDRVEHIMSTSTVTASKQQAFADDGDTTLTYFRVENADGTMLFLQMAAVPRPP